MSQTYQGSHTEIARTQQAWDRNALTHRLPCCLMKRRAVLRGIIQPYAHVSKQAALDADHSVSLKQQKIKREKQRSTETKREERDSEKLRTVNSAKLNCEDRGLASTRQNCAKRMWASGLESFIAMDTR